MPALNYHAGQIAIQQEANTSRLAENLSRWVGPVTEFAAGADLVLLANDSADGLRFSVLSGEPPLVEVLNPERIRLRYPAGGARPSAGRVGGLVINLSNARRARLNGELTGSGDDWELRTSEQFTLCRKYISPTAGVEAAPAAGPTVQTPATPAAAAELLTRADTAFLASVSPDGGPDIAHRGGPAGFIRYDAAKGELSWAEFLGDGVFKSAGNIRSTGRLTMMVPDMQTGDAIQFTCVDASYSNLRTSRKERLDALIQASEAHPVQGEIRARVTHVDWLRGIIHPRRPLAQRVRMSSKSAVDDQAPR